MDKYYASIKNECTEIELLEAGYIPETYKLDFTKLFPVTPLPELSEFSEKKKNIILLSTGSFAPVHDGHIEKLKSAKEHFEKIGFNVVAGYLSPSHDDYVLNKVRDSDYNIFERLNLLHKKIAEKKEEWILTSPWEALWNKEPINFTTVIEYLKAYFSLYLEKCPEFEIYYVYGSDNQAFGKTFKYHGKGVCVERHGHPVFNYKNVTNIKNKNYYKLNSTSIRKAKKTTENIDVFNNVYLLRDDFKRSINEKIRVKITEEESLYFVKKIQNIIKKYNSISTNIQIMSESQEKHLLKDIDLTDYISLDIYHGSKKARVSRMFKMSSGQNHPDSLICFKGLDNSHRRECKIFDDDSVSGNTLNFLSKQFNVIIKEKVLLSELYKIKNNVGNIADVADIRDFLIGAKEGGLLVSFGHLLKDIEEENSNIMKIPYIFPFINPVSRLNIKPKYILNYSIDVLSLNEWLYKNKGFLIKDFENPDTVKLANLLEIYESENILVLIQKMKEMLTYEQR